MNGYGVSFDYDACRMIMGNELGHHKSPTKFTRQSHHHETQKVKASAFIAKVSCLP
jgi:hypothetical protein